MASDNSNSFADLARRFCGLVEDRAGLTPAELLLRVQGLLAELCVEALGFPATTAFDEDAELGASFFVENVDAAIARINSEKGVQVEDTAIRCGMALGEWWALFKSLHEQLLGLSFWTVASTIGVAAPSVLSQSFSNAVADVYRDLRWGLSKWDNDGASGREEAVAIWSFSFRHHWGSNAMDLMRAIHALTHENQEDEQKSSA